MGNIVEFRSCLSSNGIWRRLGLTPRARFPAIRLFGEVAGHAKPSRGSWRLPRGLATTGLFIKGLVESVTTRPMRVKIARIETFDLVQPVSRPYGPSPGLMNERDALIVKITSDAGLVGW